MQNIVSKGEEGGGRERDRGEREERENMNLWFCHRDKLGWREMGLL